MKMRLSPSTVLAAVALLAALGGTAVAAGVFSGKQKKEIAKIATKVFDSEIGGASVKQAAFATEATKATEAAKATEATKAVEATRAVEADHAGSADRAMEATEAGRAAIARDSYELGGRVPDAYQSDVHGACPISQAVAAIAEDGSLTCTTPVRPIRRNLATGGTGAAELGDGLSLIAGCDGEAFVRFKNFANNAVNLNLLVMAQGEPARTAGMVIQPLGESTSFEFSRGRLEGQFILSTPQAILTVNLHAFKGNGFCEVTGTVLTAIL